MKAELSMEQLLRWRLARAEAEAPRAPRAGRLLDLARPWWERLPERFQSLVGRVGRIQIAYGHAMAEPTRTRAGHPVAALVVREGVEFETSARVLYLNVRDDRLRLRFKLDALPEPAPETLEVTFVADKSARPLTTGRATLSVESEYRMEVDLSEELVGEWEPLKVTDRMPFRFILHAELEGG